MGLRFIFQSCFCKHTLEVLGSCLICVCQFLRIRNLNSSGIANQTTGMFSRCLHRYRITGYLTSSNHGRSKSYKSQNLGVGTAGKNRCQQFLHDIQKPLSGIDICQISQIRLSGEATGIVLSLDSAQSCKSTIHCVAVAHGTDETTGIAALILNRRCKHLSDTICPTVHQNGIHRKIVQ